LPTPAARAALISGSLASTPMTPAPLDAMARESHPSPHPTSSTRMPGTAWHASMIAASVPFRRLAIRPSRTASVQADAFAIQLDCCLAA
jgi:hypothetical protein